jgi:hypothetical protein
MYKEIFKRFKIDYIYTNKPVIDDNLLTYKNNQEEIYGILLDHSLINEKNKFDSSSLDQIVKETEILNDEDYIVLKEYEFDFYFLKMKDVKKMKFLASILI